MFAVVQGLCRRFTLKALTARLRVTTAISIILVNALALHSGAFAAAPDDESRGLFKRAEAAIEKRQPQKARLLIDKLQHYPLTGYLQLEFTLQWLSDTTHETVAAVLREFGDLPSAFALRRAWMGKLALDGRWQLLLAHHVQDDDTASSCLAAQAKWQLGELDQAWHDTQRLWLSGYPLPDLCDSLLDAWRDAGQLSDRLVWERAKLAMANGQIKLASYLRRYASRTHAALLEQWIDLRRQPSRLPQFVKSSTRPVDADVMHVVIAVFKRAIRRDLALARQIFTKLNDAHLPASVNAVMRDQISEALANSGDPKAAQWLKYATSAQSLRAQTVNALRTHQHGVLLQAVAAMGAEQAQRERWRYWRAHSMAMSGRNDEAGQAMHSLAQERSYYGFLAADHSGQAYVLGHRALPLSADRLETISNDLRVRRTREWIALGRSKEARREWQALLSSLEASGRRDAALLAHSWHWYEGGIRAAAAAKAWDDLDIRFPIAFQADVLSAASRTELAPSRIYAVARQESAFMQDIRSSAGALGLMQLMPATARQMARTARQAKPTRATILKPANNLLLGSLYLARLQARYDGHAVLATAAYNAGPGRVRKWRQMPQEMESRLWIEAIPFTETRRYVRRVLAYQIIYAQRLRENALRLRDLMPTVKPVSG